MCLIINYSTGLVVPRLVLALMFSWVTQAFNYSSSSYHCTILLHGQFWVFPKDLGKTWLPLKWIFFPPLTLVLCDSGRDNQLRVKSPMTPKNGWLWAKSPINLWSNSPIGLRTAWRCNGNFRKDCRKSKAGSWAMGRPPVKLVTAEGTWGWSEKATTKNGKKKRSFQWSTMGVLNGRIRLFGHWFVAQTEAGYDYNNPGFLGLLPRKWVEGLTA